jgi:D-glycero-D-manno-heptose 1,7-bisphosphate phosphatase
MTQLVLLDRDGTINVERHYLSSPEQVELLPGAVEGLQLLKSLGLKTVVVTNQSAIARGYFDLDTLDRIHERLRELLTNNGTSIDAIYVCPHRPDEGCNCRKPTPGLAWKAAAEFEGDLSCSFVVGDKACDIEMGKRIGATTILVRTGYGAHATMEAKALADYVVEHLLEAAHVIRSLVIVRE